VDWGLQVRGPWKTGGILLALVALGVVGAALLPTSSAPANPNPLATMVAPPVVPASPTAARPTATAAPGRPTAWTVRRVFNPALGRTEGVVDDERVARMVQDDYLAGECWFYDQATALAQDLPAAEGALSDYFARPRLDELVGLLHHCRTQGEYYRAELQDRRLEVRNFAADGRQVYLGDSWTGGRLYWLTLDGGVVQREVEMPAGMVVVTMRYDAVRGRWRTTMVRVVSPAADVP